MSLEYWCERLADEGEAAFAEEIKSLLPSKMKLRVAEPQKEFGLARQKLNLKWPDISMKKFRESDRLYRLDEILVALTRELYW